MRFNEDDSSIEVDATDTAIIFPLELAIKKIVAPLDKRITALEYIAGITVSPYIRNVSVQILDVLCRHKSMQDKDSQKYSDADGDTMDRLDKCAKVLGMKRHKLCTNADKIVKDRDTEVHPNNQEELDKMVKKADDLILNLNARAQKGVKFEIDIIKNYNELKEAVKSRKRGRSDSDM